ncbi:MAG: M20/M25/M40 family metallo-hydrolase [Phycisphaerales bacterium]|nr:M20/M25/M40 family metallo-hydrolase [Phycisphaerales bacterium]
MNTDLLKRLCETPGIPGREERIRALIEKEVKGLFDEVRTDPMGNLLCRRDPRARRTSSARKTTKKKTSSGGRATRVMLACHMDEIGFYVKAIDDKGFIRIQPAGGFDARNMFSRRVLVCGQGGDIIGAMNPGGRPIHISSPEERSKVPEVKDFFIDIGLPAADVRRKVRVGDMIVWHEPFEEVGQKVVSKALDNRIACWLGIESVRALEKSGVAHACELHVAFTVQEEVGLRGARTAGAAVEPDLAIGLDTTLACDTPGVPSDESVTKQGEGAVLHVMDASIISDYRLINELEDVAKKKRIKVQRSILPRGGQDGAAMQQAMKGCRAAGLAVGTRYIHSVTEMIHKADLEAARDLLAAWIPTVK